MAGVALFLEDGRDVLGEGDGLAWAGHFGGVGERDERTERQHADEKISRSHSLEYGGGHDTLPYIGVYWFQQVKSMGGARMSARFVRGWSLGASM